MSLHTAYIRRSENDSITLRIITIPVSSYTSQNKQWKANTLPNHNLRYIWLIL